jgi:hypothetical protein
MLTFYGSQDMVMEKAHEYDIYMKEIIYSVEVKLGR